MLDKIPTPISGATCNEKTGWLPPNFDDNCREILTDRINELLEQQPPDFDLSAIASTSKAAEIIAKVEAAEVKENEWEQGVCILLLFLNPSNNDCFFKKRFFFQISGR